MLSKLAARLRRHGSVPLLVEAVAAPSAAQATTEIAAEIDELLTAPGGPVPIDDDLRAHCALFRSGRWVVDPGHQASARVRSVPAQAQRLIPGLVVGNPEAVSLEELSAIYGAVLQQASDPHATQMRERFYAILERAVPVRASDIHVERNRITGKSEVFFQLHGKRTPNVDELTDDEARRLFTTAFYLGDNGDTVMTEGVTQRVTVTDPGKLPQGVMSLRMQFADTAAGKLLNIRVSYRDLPLPGRNLDALDLPPQQVRILRAAMLANAGAVTVAAPTENGKSTFLDYWLMDYKEAKGGQVVIAAADDPPESVIRGIYSFNVSSETAEGDPFDVAGRTALRVNPDAIKVGEVRSPPSARLVFTAANTGKLVGTTVHCDEALDIPSRYADLEVPPEQIYVVKRHLAWLGVRLVPLLCRHCRVTVGEARRSGAHVDAVAAGFARHLPGLDVDGLYVVGDGCAQCRPPDRVAVPGIIGRRFLMEIVEPDEHLMEVLRASAAEEARRHWLASGHDSLRLSAFDMLRDGSVSIIDYTVKVATARGLAQDLRLRGRPEDLALLGAAEVAVLPSAGDRGSPTGVPARRRSGGGR